MLILAHSFYSVLANDNKPITTRLEEDGTVTPIYNVPGINKKIIHNRTYTPDMEGYDDFLGQDGGYAFRYLFTELYQETMTHGSDIQYLFNSQDIDESPEHGDFNYYAGSLSKTVPFLYLCPPLPWTLLPMYLIIYDKHCTYELRSNRAEVLILPTNPAGYNAMMLDPKLRATLLLDQMIHSDRPRLDTNDVQDVLYASSPETI